MYLTEEPGYISRYSDELRIVRPEFDSRQGIEISLFSTSLPYLLSMGTISAGKK
jgi:hypothetical protein